MDDLCTTIAAQIIAGIILYYILPERPTTVSEDGLPPITKKHSKNPKRFTKPKGLKREKSDFTIIIIDRVRVKKHFVQVSLGH